MHAILSIVPQPIRRLLEALPEPVRERVEEIRIREDRPLELVFAGSYRFVGGDGRLHAGSASGYRPTRKDCTQLLDLLTGHSVYTFEEELKRGYITVAGGHRVGLAGRTLLEDGQVRLVRDIAGFNIRIARERIGVAQELLPGIWDNREDRPHQTLIVSPPQHGKTTMIRDLARLISTGGWGRQPTSQAGRKVGIVDERSEIAACVKGVPTFDVGPRTDVLDGCPKAEGMMMLIRSMSPDVLIVDEVGRLADAEAIREALHAGIGVIATAHGRDAADVAQRPALRQLLADRVFTRIVALRRSGEHGLQLAVTDAAGRQVELPAASRLPREPAAAGRPAGGLPC